MSPEEWASLILFLVAMVLSFTRQLYKDLLPGLKPAYVFIICALICFLINRRDGKRLMVWKSIQGRIIWEMLFIFAGGMAVGSLITGSGAAKAIGDFVAQMGVNGGIVAICIFIAVPMFLANVTSNTGAASVVVPIVISIANGLGQNPIPYIYAATIGVNLAYMIPTSIRAIPVGYGLSAQYMLKVGWKITLMTLVLMTISGYLLMKYWPTFSA
jgi:sodium-dependent dicarboxylate transporter 2/3/5